MNNRFLALVAVAAVAVFHQQSPRAERPPDDAENIDNVIVTGHLTPSTGPEISSAYSFVEREVFRQRQSIFASDVLQDLPGVAVSRSGTFGSQTVVRIRGAEANQVMVMIDGIRANDIAGDDAFNFGNLTSYDIEKIEVLRGPQSALYGSEALAGVINIITRRAQDPLYAKAFVEGGSFDTLNAGGQIGTSRDKFNVNFGASHLDTEGTNISRQGNEKDGYGNTTATFNSTYEPIEQLGFDFFGRYTDAKTDFDDADFGLPIDADRTTDSTQTYLQGKMRLAVFDARWTHEWRWNWVDTDNVNLHDGAVSDSTAGQREGAYYQTSILLADDPTGATEHRLGLALDYQAQDYQQRGMVQPFGDPNKDESLENMGYVGEYVARPFEFWDLSLAIRYDDNSDFKNVATYRATTSYLFDRFDLRMRGTYGTGQKNPTFTERFGFFTSATSNFIGNPNLKPEESVGWDIGIDKGLLNGELNLQATWFNEELENEINGFFFDPMLMAATAINEPGTSDRQGLELALDAQLPANLGLFASYTYTDATEPDGAGGARREIRRPENMAAVNLNYGFMEERGNANLNISYTGERNDFFFNPNPPFDQQTVSLDAYTLVNLAFSYQIIRPVTITARLENLFDKAYEDVLGFATPGIGAFVGVRLNFSN